MLKPNLLKFAKSRLFCRALFRKQSPPLRKKKKNTTRSKKYFHEFELFLCNVLWMFITIGHKLYCIVSYNVPAALHLMTRIPKKWSTPWSKSLCTHSSLGKSLMLPRLWALTKSHCSTFCWTSIRRKVPQQQNVSGDIRPDVTHTCSAKIRIVSILVTISQSALSAS